MQTVRRAPQSVVDVSLSSVVSSAAPVRRRLAALAVAVALAAPAVHVSVTLADAPAPAARPVQLALADTVADTAAATDPALAAAVAQFKAGKYEESLTALQAIKADGLADADKKILTDATAQAQQASQLRRAARSDFEMGQNALNTGDLTTAQNSFKNVANNPYADEGTKAKAVEQMALAQAGAQGSSTDWKAMYDEAVNDFKNGNLDSAKPKFQALQNAGYHAPWFAKSPRDYLEQIDKASASPDDASQARAAYLTGRDQYKRGDWIAARQNFTKAVSLNYKAGFFEDEPAKYLARMDKKEQADAAMAARQNMAMQPPVVVAAAVPAPAAPAPDAPALPAAAVTPQVAMTNPPAAPAAPAPSPATPAEAPATPPAAAPMTPPAAPEAPAAPATPAAPMTPPAAAPAPMAAAPMAPAAAATDPQSQLSANAAQIEAERANKAYQAQQLVQSAKSAEDAQRYAEALNLYTRAYDLDATNQDALAGRTRMLGTTGTSSPTQEDAATRAEREILARRQSVTFSFNLALNQARQQIGQKSFPEAMNSISQADVAAKSDPAIFRNEEIQSFATQIADARTALERAKEDDRVQRASQAQRQSNEDAEQSQRATAEAKSRAVSSLIADSRRLSDTGRYQEALKVINQILVLDPRNEYATNVRAILFDKASLQNQRDSRERFDRELITQFNLAEEKTIPYADVLTYPADWPDISARRDKTLRDERQISAADEAVNTLLDKSLPEIRFDQVAFSDVIDFLRDTTQANIFVNWKTLEQAGIDRNAPVSTRLRNVKLSKVLRTILDSLGGGTVTLGYTVDEGVITISTTDDLAKNVETRTYDIRDLIISIPDFTDAPDFNLQSSSGGSRSGGSGGGGGGGGGSSNLFGGGGGGGGGAGGTDANTPSREELVEQITSLIRETIGVGSWKEDGGALGSLRELAGQLIVTQTPEVHRQIGLLLSKLREQRSIQVMIEARFLSVTKNFLEDVGIDFDFYFNFDGNPFSGVIPGGTIGQAVGATASTGATSGMVGTGAGGNVRTGVTQAGVDPTTGATIAASPGVVRTGIAPIGVVQNSSAFTTPTSLATGVTGNLASAFATPNLTTQVNAFLDDFQASLLFRATQGNQNVTQLTAPRLTLFNGQRAYFFVSTQQAYVSDLTPVVGTSAFGFDPTVDLLNTGVKLDVTATVSADRKYVTLTLRPDLARLLAIASFPVFGDATTATTTTTTTGGVTTNQPTETQSQFGFIQEPQIELTRVRTTVSIPDGGTLLLGGSTVTGEIEREAGVPVLSKIPFLKRAFTNRSYAKDESVILILVKPTIIIQREIEQQNFPLLTSRPG